MAFSRIAAFRIWLAGFGLQLGTYVVLAGLMIWGPPEADSGSSTPGIGFDLFYSIFNVTIAAFSFVSIYGIVKCKEFDQLFKFVTCFSPILLFAACWFAFILFAMAIAFSGGFQGE